MLEIRSEKLDVAQLATELVIAIERIEETGAHRIDVVLGEDRRVEVPVSRLRSFVTETLKPGELILGEAELRLESVEEELQVRFCEKGHVHLSSNDPALVERYVERWRKAGCKIFKQVGDAWVPRV